MFKALWVSINNANTRSKSNQNSLLLVQIVYSDANKKLYGIDRLIQLNAEKQDEQIRSNDDYALDFSKLKEAVESTNVSRVNFYTENEKIKADLQTAEKFNFTEIL
jgi:CRISPR-associated protein Csh2